MMKHIHQVRAHVFSAIMMSLLLVIAIAAISVPSFAQEITTDETVHDSYPIVTETAQITDESESISAEVSSSGGETGHTDAQVTNDVVTGTDTQQQADTTTSIEDAATANESPSQQDHPSQEPTPTDSDHEVTENNIDTALHPDVVSQSSTDTENHPHPEQEALAVDTVNNAVKLYVKEWYPKGRDYVFVCDANFDALMYDWYYGDGHKLLNIVNGDTYHRYEVDGHYAVRCIAYGANGQSAEGNIEVDAVGEASPQPAPTTPPAEKLMQYKVRIENLMTNQPLSPPVVATHSPAFHMFQVGQFASNEIEIIAEDGNPASMVALLNGLEDIRDVVSGTQPLTRAGTLTGTFTDSVEFTMEAKPGDKLSLATMLICTNDGFTGLDAAELPEQGSKEYMINAYDAGTEDNTEASVDLADPCSELGSIVLAGDPNGNEDAAVETVPQQNIQHHSNIQGNADLQVSQHRWGSPVARIIITKIDASQQPPQQDKLILLADLMGSNEVPPVITQAYGEAMAKITGNTLYVGGRFESLESPASEVAGSSAHIHYALQGQNGPVAWSLPVSLSADQRSGTFTLVTTITDEQKQDFKDGEYYINIHSTDHPTGEIRGQLKEVLIIA